MTTATMLTTLLLSMVHLSSAAVADHNQAYASACLSLFRASSPSPNTSFVFSPLSLAATLAVVHEGADELARKEIANLLFKDSPPSHLANYYSELVKNVLNDTGSQSLLMANRLFADEGFNLEKEFTAKAEKGFQAGVENVKFSDGVGSAKKINAFVAKNTGNRINNVVDASDVQGVSLVLVNALSFTSSWEREFDPKNNQMRTFHRASGKRDNIEFMTKRSGIFSYQETDSAQVLSIPYDTSNHFSFMIILPKNNLELKEFEGNLNPDIFSSLLSGVEKPHGYIDASIPKFSIKSSIPAADVLKRLGVNSIFDAGNLKKIANDPRLFVSDVKHEALLKIHENGTDAAATTVMRIYLQSAVYGEIPSFVADRPFLFAIVAEKKYPVFLGQYV